MYINLSCLSQLVGYITDAASTAFVLLPLVTPHAHTHTQFSRSQITESDISYQLQSLKKKSFKTSKTNQIYIFDFKPYIIVYAVLPTHPLFFHTHTHTTSSTSQLALYFLYILCLFCMYVCMYTYTHMKTSSFF